MLRQLPPITDPNVLVGTNTADDSAIYRLSDDLALVQTVDFFPPVVDDAYSFGAIAAANAVSDIYAMGGRPLTALNIVCFPSSGVPKSVLVDILRGGSDKAAEAGFTIVGGHTIVDREPKYGLAVTGLIDPRRVVTNATAQEGDLLVLTKPLGVGILTTAMKAGVLSDEATQRAIALMARLNKAASEAMVAVGVSAATDVTGFGLLGHLREMTSASGVAATVYASKVPVIPEAWELVADGLVPGGTYANKRSLSETVAWDLGISEDAKLVLCDAQTSGGLLIAVPEAKLEALVAALREACVDEAAVIGEIIAGRGEIRVVQ